MQTRIDDATVAFATDECVGLSHALDHVDLANSCGRVASAMLLGNVSQSTCRTHVRDRVPSLMIAEEVVSDRDQCVLLAKGVARLVNDR